MPTPQRSYNMSRIRGKDTKPELIVRKYLWAHGFRYRLNHKRLPGRPDVVLRKYRTCIFVNGCFWHGHGIAVGEEGSLPMVEVKELKSERVKEWAQGGQEVQESLPMVEVKKLKSERVKESAQQSQFLPMISDSLCCKIPRTNREYWVRKITRNKQRDVVVQKKLAEMGWHCITVWECDLRPDKREQTLESLAFTLNRIYLQDHSRHKPMEYTLPVDDAPAMAAEEINSNDLQFPD